MRAGTVQVCPTFVNPDARQFGRHLLQRSVGNNSRPGSATHRLGRNTVFLPAARLLREREAGPTLLISPLIALMRNQLLAAEHIGIRAATINSSTRSK